MLDSEQVHKTADALGLTIERIQTEGLEKTLRKAIESGASILVPWEIVTDPIAIDQLNNLNQLPQILRQAGALGTRDAIQYAFGYHLNPELPNLEPGTILNMLQAYVCLYDWLAFKGNIDLTRMLTPYISHYSDYFVDWLLAQNQAPSIETLIDVYLQNDATRNRGLDLLPLFSHLRPSIIQNKVKDTRIKSRPTFHYRIPNCDVGDPSWSMATAWNEWIVVERLASQQDSLSEIISAYQNERQRFFSQFSSKWLNYLKSFVIKIEQQNQKGN